MYPQRAILYWGLASAAFIVVGGLAQHDERDGWLLVAAAVTGGTLLIVAARTVIAGVLAVAAGLIAEVTAIHGRHQLTQFPSCPPGSLCIGFVVRPSWGFGVGIVAAFSFFLAAVLWTVLGRESVSVPLPTIPPTPSLFIAVVVGFTFFWLFAFTLIGAAGEVLVGAAGLALLARGISTLVRH